MSEELRAMVSRELREHDLQGISQVKLTEIQSSLMDFLSKCFERDREECKYVIDELRELTYTLLLLRINKVLRGASIDKSFDSNILGLIREIVLRYYSGVVGLEAAPDTASRVLVKVLKPFMYQGILLRNGDIILIDSSEAFIYEVLGFVEVYKVKIFK